ncbi:MAG: glycoside hydrolase family 88 protein [Ignavibacteriales bacterium]|nr:glycoside hydrolase family 88 protein [Ignavibacteriales bacterium]
MRKLILLIVLFFLSAASLELNAQTLVNMLYEKKLALKLGQNFIALHPDTILYKEEAKSRRWNYEQGLMLGALHQLYKVYGKMEFLDYVKMNLDYYIQDDGEIKTYRVDEYNIDNIPPGRMLLMLHKETGDSKYMKAAQKLRGQLATHPRTPEGGFWHKKIYPNQMWLDGLYMGEPFYAKYSSVTKDTSAFDDIAKQFSLSYSHTRDSVSGLLYHAWDAAKKEAWADKTSGKSPNFWGRAMGWYMMALVDVLDYFPKNHAFRPELIAMLKSCAEALVKVQDKETGLWYQVLDKGGKEGNYIEASASNMYIYAFAKGANKSYLEKKYFTIALDAYEQLLNRLVTVSDDGRYFLQNVCRVSGLGGKPYRDGSYEYYISEPKRANDFKGYGPFIFAAVELEKGITQVASKAVGLDYYYNHEFKDGKRFHYTWEDTTFSGFSEVGNLLKKHGETITPVEAEASKEALAPLKVYIVVDPDTPAETEKPNFISDVSANAIEQWVKDGGTLMLFANDSANCDFKHLNELSDRCGIHFNGDSDNRVTGKNFAMGKFDSLPSHPVFAGVRQIYLKEISSLKLFNYAEPILKRGNKAYIAYTRYGKGFVFAIGDPWLYNEYFDNRKLPVEFENYKAAENLFKWILNK